MGPGTTGLLIGLMVFVLLTIGVPVAFTLAITAITFLVVGKGLLGLSSLAENFFGGLAEFTLLSIPMFIVMGAGGRAFTIDPSGAMIVTQR